jgi:hypothetical protein
MRLPGSKVEIIYGRRLRQADASPIRRSHRRPDDRFLRTTPYANDHFRLGTRSGSYRLERVALLLPAWLLQMPQPCSGTALRIHRRACTPSRHRERRCDNELAPCCLPRCGVMQLLLPNRFAANLPSGQRRMGRPRRIAAASLGHKNPDPRCGRRASMCRTYARLAAARYSNIRLASLP